MGFRNIGSLLVLLVLFMMIFGTAKLQNIGTDLAAAIKNFKKGLQDEEETTQEVKKS